MCRMTIKCIKKNWKKKSWMNLYYLYGAMVVIQINYVININYYLIFMKKKKKVTNLFSYTGWTCPCESTDKNFEISYLNEYFVEDNVYIITTIMFIFYYFTYFRIVDNIDSFITLFKKNYLNFTLFFYFNKLFVYL